METNAGTKVEKFRADHFALMLDHVSRLIEEGCHEEEYNQCLVQSRILTQAQQALGLI